MEREFVDSREGFDGDYDGYEEWLDMQEEYYPLPGEKEC